MMMRDQVRRMLILAPVFAFTVCVCVYSVAQIANGSPWWVLWAALSITSSLVYRYARSAL